MKRAFKVGIADAKRLQRELLPFTHSQWAPCQAIIHPYDYDIHLTKEQIIDQLKDIAQSSIIEIFTTIAYALRTLAGEKTPIQGTERGRYFLHLFLTWYSPGFYEKDYPRTNDFYTPEFFLMPSVTAWACALVCREMYSQSFLYWLQDTAKEIYQNQF